MIVSCSPNRGAEYSLAGTGLVLAAASVENVRKKRRREAIGERLAGLEVRARAALSGVRDDLAADVAKTIAAPGSGVRSSVGLLAFRLVGGR